LAGAFFTAFLAAFLITAFLATAFFFAGTPRTLCAFTAKTNFATQILGNFLP
jgi:uncharacterized membrane protein HdeD (DUF308 family)